MSFGNMSPERRSEIARKAALASVASGRGHRWSTEEAKAAGAKGGAIVSRDRNHMAEIGRRGAAVSNTKRKVTAESAGEETPSDPV